jgi:hypothetical protein
LIEIVRTLKNEKHYHPEVAPPMAATKGGYVAIFVMPDDTLRIVATHDLRQYMNRMRFYGDDPEKIKKVIVSDPCVRYEAAKRKAMELALRQGVAMTERNLHTVSAIVELAIALTNPAVEE